MACLRYSVSSLWHFFVAAWLCFYALLSYRLSAPARLDQKAQRAALGGPLIQHHPATKIIQQLKS